MEDRLFTPQVVTLVFLSFVMGTSEFSVAGILTEMSRDMGLAYATVGGLVSMFAVGYAVFTPIITALVGKYSRYRVLMVMAGLFMAFNLWTLVSWDYASLAISRMGTAAVSGALLSVGITFVMDIVTPNHRAAAVSWVYAGFSIASVFGVPLGTVFAQNFGWRSVFILILAMGVPVWIAAAKLLPNRPASESTASSRGGVGALLKDSRIITGAMVTLFGAMGYFALYTYITPILEHEMGIPPSYLSLVLMAFGVFQLISNLTAGKVAEHGGFKALRFTYLGEAVLMFVLPFALGIGAVPAFIVLAGFFLMVYYINATVQMHLLEIANRDYPESMTFASSLNPVSFNIGIAIGAFFGGIAYDGYGMGCLGLYAGICMIMAAVMSVVVCHMCRGEGRGTSVT